MQRNVYTANWLRSVVSEIAMSVMIVALQKCSGVSADSKKRYSMKISALMAKPISLCPTAK